MLTPVRSFFIQAQRLFKDTLSPPFCVACRVFLQERFPLCDHCCEHLDPVTSAYLKIGRYEVPVSAVTGYSGVIRSLVMAKHSSNRCASRQLGQLVAALAPCQWDRYDCVIPVPLHWTRYAYRGFNQAAVMARVIEQAHGISYMAHVTRTNRTSFQASLSREGRQKNVASCFVLSSKAQQAYRGKHLLLVDDVMTTGATITAMCRVLATCKPASITVVVAARVV